MCESIQYLFRIYSFHGCCMRLKQMHISKGCINSVIPIIPINYTQRGFIGEI